MLWVLPMMFRVLWLCLIREGFIVQIFQSCPADDQREGSKQDQTRSRVESSCLGFVVGETWESYCKVQTLSKCFSSKVLNLVVYRHALGQELRGGGAQTRHASKSLCPWLWWNYVRSWWYRWSLWANWCFTMTAKAEPKLLCQLTTESKNAE